MSKTRSSPTSWESLRFTLTGICYSAGIQYGSFIQGVTVEQSNFTGTVIGISVPAAQGGVLSQLAVTDSQFNCSSQAVNVLSNLGQLLFTNNLVIVSANATGLNLASYNNCVIAGNQFGGLSLTNSTGLVLQTPASGSVALVMGNLFYGLALGLSLTSGVFGAIVDGNNFANNTTHLNNQSASATIRITNNGGYNPVGPASISVGGSPFTYTAGASPETVYIFGGTVSQVNIDRNGGLLIITAAIQTNCMIELGPYEQLKVTYSSLPNMTKMVH